MGIARRWLGSGVLAAAIGVGAFALAPVAGAAPDGEWKAAHTQRCETDACGFTEVEAASPDEGLALSADGDVRHWDGKQWGSVDVPVDADLASISFASAGNGWIGGTKDHGDDTRPTTLHWDGSKLTEKSVELPAGARSASLRDIDATEDGAAFAIGEIDSEAALWSLDDKGWTLASLTENSSDGGYSAVAAVDANKAIVADTGYYDEDGYEAGAVRWDGKKMTALDAPILGETSKAADVMVKGNDIYLAGAYGEDPYVPPDRGFVQRLREGTWKTLKTPKATNYSALAPAGDGGFWATGNDKGKKPMFANYDGEHWNKVTGPTVGDGDTVPESIANVPGTTTMWAGGVSTSSAKKKSFILGYGMS